MKTNTAISPKDLTSEQVQHIIDIVAPAINLQGVFEYVDYIKQIKQINQIK